jgi:hypothetical protein
MEEVYVKERKYKRRTKPIRKIRYRKPITRWDAVVEIIRPHVVKIDTPRGSGTGFLCAYSKNREICGIATAAHVVAQSDLWEEPIRIHHYSSKTSKLYRFSDRIIQLNNELDTAVILTKGDNPLPNTTLKFIGDRRNLNIGVEIGWVGFPSVAPNDLCFFTGKISYWIEKHRTYLVDGVAINGVSGGPAINTTPTGIQVIGAVSAYLPNRVGATPGLAMVSDVDQYQKVIKVLEGWDEATKRKESPSSQNESPQKTPD